MRPYVGVFGSVDSGISWQLSSQGLLTNLVYALAIDPEEPDLLYAGTNKGVFRSVTGGITWIY